eukprot:UN22131
MSGKAQNVEILKNEPQNQFGIIILTKPHVMCSNASRKFSVDCKNMFKVSGRSACPSSLRQ